eukprot:1841996-Rhodomonas_salina.2
MAYNAPLSAHRVRCNVWYQVENGARDHQDFQPVGGFPASTFSARRRRAMRRPKPGPRQCFCGMCHVARSKVQGWRVRARVLRFRGSGIEGFD